MNAVDNLSVENQSAADAGADYEYTGVGSPTQGAGGPFGQRGAFSVIGNADRTAAQIRKHRPDRLSPVIQQGPAAQYHTAFPVHKSGQTHCDSLNFFPVGIPEVT